MEASNDKFLEGKKTSSAYMQDRCVQELMEYLFNDVILHRPDDPVSYMIQTLEKLNANQKTELISDENIEVMFNMIDIHSKGTITGGQLVKCMENLEVPEWHIIKAKATLASKAAIGKKEFRVVLREALNILQLTPYN